MLLLAELGPEHEEEEDENDGAAHPRQGLPDALYGSSWRQCQKRLLNSVNLC
jgi:hypothetical protein